jgi:hypothetical protein
MGESWSGWGKIRNAVCGVVVPLKEMPRRKQGRRDLTARPQGRKGSAGIKTLFEKAQTCLVSRQAHDKKFYDPRKT